MRPRLSAYAKLAVGAAGLAAVLFAHQAPANASTAAAPASPKVVPYAGALKSGHPLALAIAPRTLTSSAWKTSKDAPGGCPANPAAVSLNASGYAQLTTSGKAGNCTWIASPKAMPTRSGYVYEADVYYSSYKDWPGYWMLGNSWPGQGELDAAEPNFGVNYVTWHQATCSSSRADTEVSTNPWAYDCKTTLRPASRNIGPGWHVIDIAWTASGVQVYYDGSLYVTIRENVTTGQNDDPMRLVFSQGSCLIGSANECVPGGEGTPGTVQVKYVRVFS
ncbi:MAG TPA: glycoside hydrolase family 16 protein [Trebonia sp.]